MSGAVTLPPLFCGAELKAPMSGRDFLTAAVAGYEVGPRVGNVYGTEHIVQGWHSGATVAFFRRRGRRGRIDSFRRQGGARARHRGHAVGRAMRSHSAHGQAHARRPLGAERTLCRALRKTNSAESPTCSKSQIWWILHHFRVSQDRFDLSELTSGLGERFETMRIALKFYSCVAPTTPVSMRSA